MARNGITVNVENLEKVKTIMRHQERKIQKLKRLLLLVDSSVSKETVTELQSKQWQEYIKTFPDEV